MEVEILEVSFDGECFLSTDSPLLPVSLGFSDIVVNNECES